MKSGSMMIIDMTKSMVKGFFDELKDYARMHPYIALNITCVYFDCLADILQDPEISVTDLSGGQSYQGYQNKIAIHLRNAATRLDRSLSSMNIRDLGMTPEELANATAIIMQGQAAIIGSVGSAIAGVASAGIKAGKAIAIKEAI